MRGEALRALVCGGDGVGRFIEPRAESGVLEGKFCGRWFGDGVIGY